MSEDLQFHTMLPVPVTGDSRSVSDLIALLLFGPAKATLINPLVTVTDDT